MGIYANLPGKITEETLVGYVPRDILRFCFFFTKYIGGGVLSAVVRETKFPPKSSATTWA